MPAAGPYAGLNNLNLNNMQPGSNNPWFIDPNNPMQMNQEYVNLLNQGATGVTAENFQSDLQGYGNQFANTFKQMTGKDPTAQDYNSFFQNIVANNILNGGKGIGGTNYADVQNLVNPFIQNQYGQQIQQYQQGQQQQQLQNAQQQAQNVIDQQTKNTINYLTSQPVMEQFKGAMNQNGMLNSGLFSQQLADRLAQASNQNQSQALGSIGLPAIQGQMQTAQAPYQQWMANMNPNLQQWGQGATDHYNFNRQAELANQLAMLQQPSTLQQWSPIISSIIRGAADYAAAPERPPRGAADYAAA